MENVNLIMLLVLFLGGLFFIALAVIRYSKAKKAAETWLTVTGSVLSSDVTIHRSHSSKGYTTVSYMPKVTYEYQVNGQKYIGDGIGFGNATYGKQKADNIAAAYPQGSQVDIHYNPADPSKAVLEPKSVGGGNLIALGIIMIAVGFMYIFVISK